MPDDQKTSTYEVNKMTIETNRLILIPLTAYQLRLWIEDMTALERELTCSYDAEPLKDVFLEIVKGQLTITENDELNYLFHSFWFVIRKEDRVVVGSADFKALPDTKGEVEIGYGLGKNYEHHDCYLFRVGKHKIRK